MPPGDKANAVTRNYRAGTGLGLRLQQAACPKRAGAGMSVTARRRFQNLAHAARLGLMGHRDFPSRRAPTSSPAMEKGGAAAMEALARDSRRSASTPPARLVSFEGIEHDLVESAHRRTNRIYDAYADAFQIIQHAISMKC